MVYDIDDALEALAGQQQHAGKSTPPEEVTWCPPDRNNRR